MHRMGAPNLLEQARKDCYLKFQQAELVNLSIISECVERRSLSGIGIRMKTTRGEDLGFHLEVTNGRCVLCKNEGRGKGAAQK